jgi:hypothetical protein
MFLIGAENFDLGLKFIRHQIPHTTIFLTHKIILFKRCFDHLFSDGL